jgi:hypothetical protein
MVLNQFTPTFDFDIQWTLSVEPLASKELPVFWVTLIVQIDLELIDANEGRFCT